MAQSFKNITIFIISLVVLTMVAQKSYAVDATTGLGSEDFATGMLPPSGFHLVNYMNIYSSDKLMDNAGNEIPGEFELKVFAEAPRLFYISKPDRFGWVHVPYIVMPFVHIEVTTPNGKKDEASGLGDIVLGYKVQKSFGRLHIGADIDLTVPTGAYDKDNLANVGSNHYRIEPILNMNYLLDNGIDFSGRVLYAYNTENNATDYQNGEELLLMGHFGFAITDTKLKLGFGGYIYNQISDDKLNGKRVANYKAKVSGFGPTLQYALNQTSMFVVKYQKEVGAKNTSQGERIWFKFYYSF